MIDLAALQVVVMAHPLPVNPLLSRWLSGLGVSWRTSPPIVGLQLARNKEITRFLGEDTADGKTHLIMLDHDVVPLAPPYDIEQGPTAGVLTEPGDLVWCGMAGPQGRDGHVLDGDFGAACCRMSAGLLGRIEPPWFKPAYNAAWTQETACECQWFHGKAKAAGVQARRVGVVGHQQGGGGGCILVADPGDPRRSRLLWPADLG